MKRLTYFVVAAILLIGCKVDKGKEQTTGILDIVTTTGMIADLVRNIGQDSVNVTALMGAGIDPHLYKATQGDLVKLQKADLIFYNGLHLEGKMGEVFEKLARIKTVIAVSDTINEDSFLTPPEFKGAHDPHIWFDVSLWSQTVDLALATLIESRPLSSTYFKTNAEKYKTQLADLDQWMKIEMQKIPNDQRILITAHDAFNYFGRAYDIEVRGLQGISTLSEFGLKDRVDLVNYVVENRIKSVFVETSVSERNIKAIVEGCKQKGHDLTIGGNLFSDAMGPDGTIEGTYIGMLTANVNTIVNALK